MDSEKRASFSSYLIHPVPILSSLAACTAAALFNYTVLAAFFGFVFALTGCSYCWGRAALKRLDYKAGTTLHGVFPGQQITVKRTIANRKMIPLLWLEVLEPCRPDGCAVPEEELIVRNPLEPSPDTAPLWDRHRCLHTISFLKWRQTISFEDGWQAKRRGIQRIFQVTLRSGDGFGLCVAHKTVELTPPLQMTVYPVLVDVSVERILNDMWDSRSSSHGYLEDRTLLRGVRDYQGSDSARHINQRLLARGQGLKVNQYEVVSPDSVLFVFDAASFAGEAAQMEEAISITASLISGLMRRGIKAGVALPASTYFPATVMEPSTDVELTRVLELMAGIEGDSKPLPRELSCPFPDLLGQTYYVSRSADSATSLHFLAQFPIHKIQMLVMEEERSADAVELRLRPLKSFRRTS